MKEISFLEERDYVVFISPTALQKVVRQNINLEKDSEFLAYSYISDKLSKRFDIESEIQNKGDVRNPTLVRWMTVLAIYYLYQSIPDDEIPERVIKNYDDVIKEMQRVASGKDNTNLSSITDSDGNSSTVFQWSSQKRRTHNPFSD